MRLLFALLALLPMLLAPASRAQQVAEAPKLQLVGHYGGSVSAVALRPPYAYIGVGNSLEVLDISELAAPRRVGVAPLPRQVHAIALQGDYAYLMGEPILSQLGMLPLMVVDVIRPDAPRLLRMQMPKDGFGGAISVAGRYAYISGSVVPGGPGQVRVLDLANPAAPQELATIGDLAGQRFAETALAGPFLFAAAGYQGLRIFDVADPREANELGSYTPSGPDEGFVAVEVAGRYAYTLSLVEGDSILRIFDVSDPGAPKLLGSVNQLGYDARMAYGTAPNGAPRIYVAGPSAGSWPTLRAIDVSAPASPRVLSGASLADGGDLAIGPISTFVNDFAVAPGFAVVASGSLTLHSTQSGVSPEPLGSYAPLAPILGLALSDAQLLLESPGMGSRTLLTPVDVSDPAAPRGDGPLSSVGGTGSVLVGDTLYVPEFTAFPALGIYTRSADGSFAEAGRLETAGVVRALAVRDATAFLIDEVDGLVTVDVSDPAAPRRLDALALQSTTTPEIVIEGGRAYVPTCQNDQSGAVTIIDIGDPGAMATVGAFNRSCNGTVVSLAAQGTTLYLHESFCVSASCTRWLRTVDVADPAAPQERGMVEIGSGFPSVTRAAPGFLILGASIGTRFILDESGAIALLDVSDPAQPRLVETIELSSPVSDLAVAGPIIYAAGNDGGLSVARAAPLFAPTELVYLPLARP
jgi:hypothetical protein